MRVLFVSNYPHLPDIVGGLQTTTHDLALALLNAGAEVAILCGLGERPGTGAPSPERDESMGYTVFRSPDPLQALPMVTAAWDPAILVVQSGTTLAPLIVRALETGRPTAVYLHNVEMHQVGGILLPDPSLLYLANSDFTARRWHALCGIDCAVIPPLVDPERYLVAETGDKVLFVNPTPIKGVEILFALAAACPDVSFLVAESWKLEPRWRALCRRRAEGTGNVVWTAPTHDMRTLYAQARVLLMPSLWEEAFGRTAIEAQLNGIPVLASNRGALPETIGAGGLLVEAHAPVEIWRAALHELTGQAYPAFSQAAQNNALQAAANGSMFVARLLSLLMLHANR